MKTTTLLTLIAACALIFTQPARSEGPSTVPGIINYQGRVASGGVNFNGTGQFKFALVGAAANVNQQATAIPVVMGLGDGMGPRVTAINITNGGSGYTSVPAVTISDPTGTGAAATAVITGGVVTAINVTANGLNYNPFQTTVTIDAPPVNLQPVTLWSNDGTSTYGSEPGGAVPLTVAGGLYAVTLGNTALANMQTIPDAVFSNADVRLRVWFNDGVHGFQQLTPDQKLAAAPYAFRARLAETVPDGSIVAAALADGAVSSAKLASGAVTTAKLAPGAIGSTQLAPGAAASNLAAGGQSAVASGGIVLSRTENAALLAAGYARFGTTQLTDNWQQRANGPGARRRHTVVWTGSEMIVWGGIAEDQSRLNTGARYDPSTNTWSNLPTNGAPTARDSHSAVWTGNEMIIWGGYDGTFVNDGARYNPATNAWTPLPTASAPTARLRQTAVWTGTEMIVWGGELGITTFNDGARYNPASNSWTALPGSLLNTPGARYDHSAVWTGNAMIVWGGIGLSTFQLNTGASYRPGNNSWTAIPDALDSILYGLSAHRAVWTGSEMLAWGGISRAGTLQSFGLRYNPLTNIWSAMTTVNAPTGRKDHTAVWTGSEMIVWGGNNIGVTYNGDGGRYNVLKDTWTPIASVGAPSARGSHTAVWSGGEMFVFGGYDGGSFNDTWAYTPGKEVFLYQKP